MIHCYCKNLRFQLSFGTKISTFFCLLICDNSECYNRVSQLRLIKKKLHFEIVSMKKKNKNEMKHIKRTSFELYIYYYVVLTALLHNAGKIQTFWTFTIKIELNCVYLKPSCNAMFMHAFRFKAITFSAE